MKSPQSTVADSKPSVYEKALLIGSLRAEGIDLDLCPWSKCMSGYSMSLQETVYVQQKCKRWGCRHCGERKVQHMAHRTAGAAPNRLLTLTTWTKNFVNPREAFEKCSPMVAVLIRQLRKRAGSIEYLRVVEQHKNGFPHWHLILRSNYIRHADIKEVWRNLTGNFIVDIRPIKKREGVYWYIVKYLGKQSYCHFTDRRVSWSRKFFRDEEKPSGLSLDLELVQFHNVHPAEMIEQMNPSGRVVKLTRDVLIVNPSESTMRKLE